MQRKKFLIVISFSGLILAVLYQFSMLEKMGALENTTIRDSIPAFEFTTVDGTPYTYVDLPLDEQPVIFMYMDPTCDDCEKMIIRIQKYFKEFEKTTFLMITEADTSQMRLFESKYSIKKYPNIILLQDRNQTMFRNFELVSVPSFVVYNAEKKLVKIIGGNFNLSIVVKYVREATKKKSPSIL